MPSTTIHVKLNARRGEKPADDDLQAAVSHAQDAIRFVDETDADLALEATYDEYSVVARLDDSRIVGDIDRLLVTPDACHIIDYKTNDLSSTTTDTLADHYRPQMLAYALALFSTIPPGRSVLHSGLLMLASKNGLSGNGVS